jgi:hypothetical protein
MGRVWRVGPRHDPLRASCGAWVVDSALSAGPAWHDYFFYFKKIIYTYVQFKFNIINTWA